MKAYSFHKEFIPNPYNISKRAPLNDSFQCEPHSTGGVEGWGTVKASLPSSPFMPGSCPLPLPLATSVCLSCACMCILGMDFVCVRCSSYHLLQGLFSGLAVGRSFPPSFPTLSLTAHMTPRQEGENPSFSLLKLWSLQPGRISLLTV